MVEILRPQAYIEYEMFVRKHPKGHFAQSLAWAKQKRDWNHAVLVSRGADGAIRGGMLILLRQAGPLGMAYSCRGPVCAPDDMEALRELLTAAAAYCKSHGAVLLRIDPDVPHTMQDYRETLETLGFQAAEGGAQLDQTQAKFVFRLLIAGKSEEELLAQMNQKTRYNIRLAQRRGVEVRVCGREMIPVFAELMEKTGRRDGFCTRKSSYFSKILDNFGTNARLYMAFYQGKVLAGAIALQYGDKTWYLYGASGNEHREVMPNYLLQWEMIRWAVEGGCSLYDFRGVPGGIDETHPLYGLWRFKRGFGGELTEFIGEMNLVLHPLGNRLMMLGLTLYRAYKHVRIACVRGLKNTGQHRHRRQI